MTQQTTTRPLKTTRTPTRTFQLRRAHELARQAGYVTRPAYEAMLEDTLGVDSLRQASREQREAVIRRLEVEIAGRRMYPLEPVSDEEALDVLN